MGHTARTKLANLRDYVVIDLETTGLSPRYNEIIEAAAIRIENGQVVDTYQSFSDPGYPIDEFITELTGITDEMVAGAPENEIVKKEMQDFIGGAAVLGHNVCFDLGFLELDPDMVFDTRRISMHVLSCRQTLDAVYGECRTIDPSIQESQHHRALADCQMTYACYETMRPLLVEKYGDDPEEGYRKLSRLSSGNEKKASEYEPTVDNIDESNPFFGCNICFTGKLGSMTRAGAYQHAANLGATPQGGVTKKTDYLVIGSTDYCSSLHGEKSSKHKKAEQMQADGHHILIIDEDTFLSMINS